MKDELKQMRAYIKAMKKAKTADEKDCDNLLMHLDNIETIQKQHLKDLQAFDTWHENNDPIINL